MPTPTYVPLATITLGTAEADIEFSSIPATFRDLILVFNGTVSANAAYQINFNGVTTGYSRVGMFADSGGPISFADSTASLFEAGTAQSTSILHIMDYAQTDKHKSVLTRSNISGTVVVAFAGRFASTSAVTSFRLFRVGQTFSIGSTFSLYGIA